MFNIKTLNKIDQEGLELFSEDYQIVEDGDIDAIVLRSFKMQDYPLDEKLQAVARAGAGTNNVPVDKCAEKGIVVFNTPGANANGVKELVVAGLLMSSRNIVGAIEWAKTLVDEGEEIPKLVEAGKSNFAGPEIKGKTLGIIGLGAIGVLTANAASGLGMKVIGYDPFLSVKHALKLSRSVSTVKTIEEIYSKSDYISVHVPLVDATKGMINDDSIALMENGVKILNFSRAELIDDDAMAKALESGKVSNYVTDFPNASSIKMKNVIAIPHLGASTPESETNCAIMAVNQVMEYLENGNIINSVNYPDCDMGVCPTASRIAVNHKNIPNMVSQITSILADHNINIADMINKSRGDWAYTMLDIENESTKEIITALEQIDGVVKVRIIV
ncbi:MAG: 3-phosphoglycerate dehydrogenase [Firmicutes bacterium HGW-Firmicutes-5]|nr:MAG: 3-phosphoglycerate dehydrogenase [Firmicutes bacterium HGW-Firmicutes-5]